MSAMRRRKNTKFMKTVIKRLTTLTLAVALVMALLLEGGGLSFAADDATGDTYQYISMKDLTNASRYGGATIAENFLDTHSGGTDACGNYALLLQNVDDYVEYDFDLADSVETAVLKVNGKHAVVSVSTDGSNFQTLTARNGAAADRGINIFELTKDNALASADRKFTVRIGFDGQAVVLNGLAVVAKQPELTEDFNLDVLGESYLRQVEDVSAGVTRYFDQGTIPTIHLHTNEYVTFRFDYADNAVGLAYQYGIAGSTPLTGEVSLDGSAWTALPADSGQLEDVVSLSADKVFYLRFTADAGEAFLKSLSIHPTYPEKEEAIDAGTGIYLPLNSLSAATRYGGAGLAENYNDGHSGGDDTRIDNKTLLLQQPGDYVEYDFDMADEVTETLLKLYITAGKVEVKAKNANAFTELRARNGSGFNRNVAIYELDETNALSDASKAFTLRISYNGSTVILNSLLLASSEPLLTGNYELNLLGESYLSQLADISSGASRYFLDQTEPTIHLHANEQVTFRFNYGDTASGFQCAYSQAGAELTAEVNTDGKTWQALPADGGIHKEAFPDLSKNGFYVRFTADREEGFLRSLTITPTSDPTDPVDPDPVEFNPMDVGSGIYLPLSSLSTATRSHGAGLAENYNDGHSDGDAALIDNKTLLLQQPGDYVEYDLDMADNVTNATLKLYIAGGKVEVRPKGATSFTELTAKNGSGFNRNVAIYELDETNALSEASRGFTLRISHMGSTAVLNSMLIESRDKELSESYDLNPLGENYLRQLADISPGASRYFADKSIPTVHLHTNEYVTFRFDYVDNVKGIRYAWTQLGEPLKAEVSADGRSWNSLSNAGWLEEAMELSANRIFYIRFTAEKGEGFLKSLKLTPSYEEAGELEELDYCYLPVKDLSDASGYGGSSIVEEFNDTYSDGYQTVNPTLLLQSADDYVEYEFNLPDHVTRATLKVYTKDGVVSVKPDGGRYKTLKARNDQGGRFDRNVAIFNLGTNDALASANRTFTLRIGCNGTDAAVVQGMLLETVQKKQTGSYTFEMLGESFLKNLTDISQGASRYFADEKDPTVFLHKGEMVSFFFDYGLEEKSLDYTIGSLGAPLTAEASPDGKNWVSLPGGGSLDEVLAFSKNKSFHIRFTAREGDSFLKSLTIVPTEKAKEAEEDYIYMDISDLNGVKGFGGSTIVENYTDSFTGGTDDKVDNKTLLLQSAGDYVEYGFNLTDSCSKAILKVYMKDAVISVKPEGGQYVTLKARNEEGGRFDRNVAIFELDETNALSASNKKFTLRIGCNGRDAVVVNGLVLDAKDPEIASGRYELDVLGESFLRGLYDISQDSTRYFHQETIPTVFLRQGGRAVFRMHFAEGGKAYNVFYETLGADVTVEVSLDGTSWVPLKGKRVDRVLDMGNTGTYYLRFMANEGESFLKSLVATRETVEPVVEYNTNPNVPKNITYAYFKPGTSQEEKYMFGLGEDYKSYFERTNDGMGIDGFEGGYDASLPPNVRMFDSGKQVTYEFDLDDSIGSADLRVYGLGEMKFLVSTDEGEIWDEIRPSCQPTGNDRGYYIFSLTEENALKNPENRFRLKIQGTPFGRLFEVMVKTGTPAVDHGVQFEPQSEDGLRYLHSYSDTATYYAYEAFPNYYIKDGGSMIFEVPVAKGIREAILYATYSGGVELAVATSAGGRYETLLKSSLDSSGTPPTNTFDVSGYLGKSRTLYIRLTGFGNGGFVDSLGMAVTEKDKGEGGFKAFHKEEANYIYSVKNNAAGVGTSMRQTDRLSKVRGLEAGGEIVYKFDLPGGINGVDINLKAKGEYGVTVSLDGEAFVPIMQVGKRTDAIREQEQLAKSQDKVLYVKISNTSTRELLMIQSLSYTVKGVPKPYERPETPDFDYAKTLPDSFPVVERLAMPKEPAAIFQEEINVPEKKDRPWVAVAVAAAAAALAAGGTALGLWIRKRGKKA